MATEQNPPLQQALAKIERIRERRGISIRRAAERTPKISEGYWRQLVAGGTRQGGVWVPRIATVDQVLKMAATVGIADEIARDLGVDPPHNSPEEQAAYALGWDLDDERLAIMLRVVDHHLLLAELARRLDER